MERFPRKALVAVAAAGVLGGIGGVAFATDRAQDSYPVNAAGDTYGSVLWSGDPATEPDLIQADTTTGVTGYVRRVDLDEADGSNVTTPDEALAFQEQVDELVASGVTSVFIPVYEADGRTVIGEFEISLVASGARWPADGEGAP